MTVKYHVVGAQTSTGVELKYSFNSKDIALRYANFYSGNTLFPRKPEHVGSVLVKGDTFEEQLTALIEDGGLPFLRPTTSWALSPFAQRIGRVTRKPAFSVDVSKLLEGLNLPSADELVKILTGSGDSSGIRVEPFRVNIEDSLESKALSRMLSKDSAERISLEEMIKRYSFGADPATPFSDETPEVKCGCMLCAISDEMELEMKRQREAADAPKADATDANGQQYTPEDPLFEAAAETPAAEELAESAAVGNDPIVPVLGKSYYVKLVDFDQAQLIKAKVLHVSDKVVELEFTFREMPYIAAYQRILTFVKFLEEIK